MTIAGSGEQESLFKTIPGINNTIFYSPQSRNDKERAMLRDIANDAPLKHHKSIAIGKHADSDAVFVNASQFNCNSVGTSISIKSLFPDIFCRKTLEATFASDETCAIVGNSDLALQHKHGSLINEHDVVIRCNDAPTKGYEEHVGSKSSIRIANRHLFRALIPREADNYLEDEMKKQYSMWKRTSAFDWEEEIILAWYWHEFTPEEQDFIEHNIKGKLVFIDEMRSPLQKRLGVGPTVGLLSIYYALQHYKRPIDCFGFSHFFGDGFKHGHYWETIKLPGTSHTHGLEQLILQGWEKIGLIKAH